MQVALQTSDFTLCPAGFSLEAYRIYEAMSFGSVPILQRTARILPGSMQSTDFVCLDTFRLFKDTAAPVVWIDDWSEIKGLLDRLSTESDAVVARRRRDCVHVHTR